MAQKPQLVVMAAGLGSRYGGLKQMDAVTEAGEIILDFSVYDAVQAGFEEVLFIIRPQMEETFRSRVMEPMAKYVRTDYVFQTLQQLPQGYQLPEGRVKPWGTCHAMMACGKRLDAPFAIINADDYYGRDAFAQVYRFLSQNEDPKACCMAGYFIENTLSDTGAVTRGVCRIEDGFLSAIRETHQIRRAEQEIIYEELGEAPEMIAEGTPVSMNFWGFTPQVAERIAEGFPGFLDHALETGPLTAEYLLPTEVGKMIAQEEISVRVLPAHDRWYGVTYREDHDKVQQALEQMKQDGNYPARLWP